MVSFTQLAEEVLLVFLEAMEEVVMVVIPAVAGNLTLDVVVGLEDILNLNGPGWVKSRMTGSKLMQGCTCVGVGD